MADYSAPRKSKVTKKTDKGSRLTDRSQVNVNLADLNEEKLSNEPYQCTGRLFEDFQSLCRQNRLTYIPPILHRGKRPSTPTLTDVKTEKSRTKKGTVSNINFDNQSVTQSDQLLNAPLSVSQKQQSISTLNEQDETKESDIETLPKTFVLIKDRMEYFKPKIQVEVDSFERTETVTEFYVRGWKIEPSIMNILKEALPFSEKLAVLNLWYVGLTEETLEILASFLPKCPNLKNIALDGNPLSEENFHRLITPESILQHLSLRNCRITDVGAEKLGKELGTIKQQNTKLLTLNLSGNLITDNGAIELARGLRTNRTLLVLNLAGNEIGDLGACKFAETLSRFKMTHEEIVRRRTMKRERLAKELSPASRKNKSDMADRPPSFATHKTPKDLTKIIKKDKLEATLTRDRSKSKDVPAGRESVVDNKQNSIKAKKEKDSVSSILIAVTQKKEKTKETLANSVAEKMEKMEKTAVKSLKTKGSKKTAKDETDEALLRSPSKLSNAMLNDNDPLMDEVEGTDGELFLNGNRTLISLNLSRNRITLIGVKELLLCVQMQHSMTLLNKSATANPTTGLLKLNLHKNDFQVTNESFIKLSELMKVRDPIANKANETLADKDTMSIISKDGRETNRSKSSRMKVF